MTSAASYSPELAELAGLSARVGSRIDLVQGPGGNVSQKIGDTLWIKASGTWLADARARNIFVPIGLASARERVAAGIADLSPCVVGTSAMRPSIETAMHALLEAAVVVHVHSVNTIAWAVRVDGRDAIAPKLDGLRWGWLDYARPGRELAEALRNLLAEDPGIQVVLLGNHGLTVAANTVGEAEALVNDVEKRLGLPARSWNRPSPTELERHEAVGNVRLPGFIDTHALARDQAAMALASEGAMYPDHAVFLGCSLPVVSVPTNDAERGHLAALLEGSPHCAVLAGAAVLLGSKCTSTAEAMLACCALVALRVSDPCAVRYLPSDEAAALSSLEMEKFRQRMNR